MKQLACRYKNHRTIKFLLLILTFWSRITLAEVCDTIKSCTDLMEDAQRFLSSNGSFYTKCRSYSECSTQYSEALKQREAIVNQKYNALSNGSTAADKKGSASEEKPVVQVKACSIPTTIHCGSQKNKKQRAYCFRVWDEYEKCLEKRRREGN